MKIGYDAKRFFHNASGLGNYSRDLVRILAQFYPENSFFLFAKSTSESTKSLLEISNVLFRKISGGKFARQYKMGKDAQAEGCDIFHGLSGELPLKWTKQPIKKVVTIHDVIFLKYPQFYSFFDRKIHAWKCKNACEQADLVIAISQQTKRDIIHFFKTPEEKIRVVYQSCHQAFKENYSEEELVTVQQKYSLPQEFLLNVGTIEERKNLFSVVKAIKDTDIPLVVIGKETSYTKQIHRFIEKNKMQNQVFFLKNVSMDDLAKIYQLATVFIYPSLYEGFGIPIIEALFSKTPVITSNISCLPEAGGPDSLYIDPKNVADLKSKILYLMHNPSERQRRVEKSSIFVQKFSEEQIANDVFQMYQEVLSK